LVEQVSNSLLARSSVPEGRPVPRVTVVVPCFKQAHYLEECLESVFSQSYQAFEIVVVDDASPDGEDIVRVVERLGDARVRVVRHERNKGLGGSRNTGFREARTEFVLPLDADDRIAPFCLEALTAPLERDPGLDCAYGDVQLFGRDDELVSFPGPKPGTKLLRGQDTIPGAGTLTRRALWERVGGYDESDVLRQGREDFEFWIRAFDGGCRFEHVSRPTYYYRITHSSMNAECKLNDHEIALYIYGKHRKLFDAAGERRLFLSHWHRRAAQSSQDRGQIARAFALAWRAWRYYPDRSRFRFMLSTLVPLRTERWLKSGELRRLVPLASYPLRGEARHRPFFVIGVGRSGNTLLRRILTAHEELHIPPETFVLGECIRTWKGYGRRLNWRDLVTLVLGKFAFHPEWSTFGITLETLVERLADLPRPQRNLADVLDAFYRFHAEKAGKRPLRWGDKTPMNSLDDQLVRGDEPRRLGDGVPETLERLLRVFPDAQFIHIYRDGCDVVHSHLQGGFYTRLEDAAKRWLHVERQTRRFAREHRERSIDVRYEDLVSRPEEVVRGLCAFLGVEFEPRMLASEGQAASLGDVPAWSWHGKVGKPIDGANPGKGRRLFSRAEKEELQRWIGPELAELGYPPATLDPAGGPADASTSLSSSP
jgi:protein-tyrosine sulfotransferase